MRPWRLPSAGNGVKRIVLRQPAYRAKFPAARQPALVEKLDSQKFSLIGKGLILLRIQLREGYTAREHYFFPSRHFWYSGERTNSAYSGD